MKLLFLVETFEGAVPYYFLVHFAKLKVFRFCKVYLLN